MFPVEIWENILQYVEAASLLRLRSVSKTWNTIITKYLQESDAWYKQCKNDIPEKYWLILLENSFHLTTLNKCGNNDDKDKQYYYKIWKTMYRAWIKWYNINNFKYYLTDEFNPIPEHRPSEHITCSASLGELIAIGTTEGYIRIFNLRTNKLVFRIDQYEEVVDVKLCVQGKSSEKIVLISTSVHNKTRVWDIISQKCLMFIAGDVICAGYGYYCVTLCHNKILVYNAMNEDYTPVRLLFINDLNESRSKKFHQEKLNNMKFLNMLINKHKLYFWSNAGLFCELDLQEIDKSSTVLYTPDIKSIGVPKNQKVRNYFLFNPFVVFCITEAGHLGISVHKSKWQIYNVFPFLQSAVTAILFYVRVLVIGLESGDVYLFPMKNEMSLKTIDFKCKSLRKLNVAAEPIIALNIMEILGDQRLLVLTKSKVYHIKFDISNFQH